MLSLSPSNQGSYPHPTRRDPAGLPATIDPQPRHLFALHVPALPRPSCQYFPLIKQRDKPAVPAIGNLRHLNSCGLSSSHLPAALTAGDDCTRSRASDEMCVLALPNGCEHIPVQAKPVARISPLISRRGQSAFAATVQRSYSPLQTCDISPSANPDRVATSVCCDR